MNKYQRKERRRRTRESQMVNQQLITTCFPIVNEVQLATYEIINTNEESSRALHTMFRFLRGSGFRKGTKRFKKHFF